MLDAQSPQPAFSEQEDGSTQEDSRLSAEIEQLNIAVTLEESRLAEIGDRVKRETEIDEESRAEWLSEMQEAIKLAKQTREEKSTPWPRAANIKYPLMTTAAVQFNARSYSAIVSGRDVVKPSVIGGDRDGTKQARGQRITTHMNYQLLHEMTEWDEDTDRLLVMLPIVGCLFRKTSWDVKKGRPRSELCLPDDIIVSYTAKDLKSASRITHRFKRTPNEIHERKMDGRWLDVEFDEVNPEQADDESAPVAFLEQHRWLDLDDDGYEEPYIVTAHEDSGKVLRISPRFDPEDVEMDGKRILRIEPTHHFTKYGFIPAMDGGFYDTGFGSLLSPINRAVNTTINQLLDAGTLSNAGGGFIGANSGIKQRQARVSPGKWEFVDGRGEDLAKSVYPWPHGEPSAVLFNLLGLLIEAGKEISGLKDVLTGDMPNGGANMPATTVMALIEQGQKVFNGIYKRIHRSLKDELGKLRRLNRLYLEPERYLKVIDWRPEVVAPQSLPAGGAGLPPQGLPQVAPGGHPAEMPGLNMSATAAPAAMPHETGAVAPPMAGVMGGGPDRAPPPIPADDYADEDCDIVPVSDPTAVSEQQKLGKAQFLMQFAGAPGINTEEIYTRLFEAAGIEDSKKLLLPPDPNAPPPPEMLKLQLEAQVAEARAQEAMQKLQLEMMKAQQSGQIAGAKAEIDARKQDLAEAQFELEGVKAGAELGKTQADIALKTGQTVKVLEEAEAVQPGMQVEERKVEVAAMQKRGGGDG